MTTRTERARLGRMTDAELRGLDRSLRHEIPAAQSLQNAVKREIKRRQRAAKKVA